MKTCPRCSSERLFQFEATKSAVSAELLPVTCRDCGLTMVGDKPLAFPHAFEEQAKSLAEAAAEAGKSTKEEILADPDARIEAYFTNVYRRAYLDGFVRALMFSRYNAKEGRLRRVREIWRQHSPLAHVAEHDLIAITLPKAAYDELRWLLEIGEHHGPCPQDQHPTKSPGDARVP